MSGGYGHDTVCVSNSSATVSINNSASNGGHNTVTVNGGGNKVIISDQAGGDTITVGGNSNTVTLSGTGGGDTINFGTGGGDTLVLGKTPSAYDTVSNFIATSNRTPHDTIDVSALGLTHASNIGTSGLSDNSVGWLTLGKQSAVITDINNVITEALVVNGSLNASDFTVATPPLPSLTAALKRV